MTSQPDGIAEAVAKLRILAARFGDKTMVEVCDTHPDNPSPNIEPVMGGVFKTLLAALSALPAPAPARENKPCETCQGNGEVVTDWDRYQDPHSGDKGDEAVAPCPDCDGTGEAAPPPPQAQAGEALADIAVERRRQVDVEGWSLEHDDGHDNGEIAEAAAQWASRVQHPLVWSWASDKAKHPRRRQLVIAGALIVAEIERLDRSAAGLRIVGEGE